MKEDGYNEEEDQGDAEGEEQGDEDVMEAFASCAGKA
jgi:hypothetical protein